MSSDTGCLLARAVPNSLPHQPKDMINRDGVAATQESKKPSNAVDSLTDSLSGLKLEKKKLQEEGKKTRRVDDSISPADFVNLQSIRSSALARKTNTTKFSRDCRNLFADLLAESPPNKAPTEDKDEKKESDSEGKTPKNLDDEKKSDKVEESSVKEEKNDASKEDELLFRGPVRTARATANYHPYGSHHNEVQYGAAPQSAVYDSSSFSASSNGYDCGAQYWPYDSRDLLSNSSTPDTIVSDFGYNSANSPMRYNGYNSYGAVGSGSPQIPTQLNEPHVDLPKQQAQSPGGRDRVEVELPDALSDFILKFSRHYASSELSRKSSLSDESPTNSPKNLADTLVNDDSLCNSPLSAISAPCESSPSAPFGGVSGPPITPPISANTKGGSGHCTPPALTARRAKKYLRSLIRDEDMDEAWAWTCKCIQQYPGALLYQDTDRDTLLHIVTVHMDRAKIYSLVEQMLKMETSGGGRKPFDMANRLDETPLFLAVEKRQNDVIDYLLEAGADPNTQNLRPERDAPIHFAAANGFDEIVQTLCSYSTTNLNQQNGMGLTPLLCAVKNHGLMEEESQRLIDSKAVIKTLLKYGADATVTDATNGKTVIHYALEHLDIELIEIFQLSLSEQAMTELVNKPDLSQERPMDILKSLRCTEAMAQLRSQLCLTLITCGAAMN